MTWRRWIKLYIEILDDPKMGRMPDWLWRRTVELFLLAGEDGNGGELQPVEELAWRLRTDEARLTEALESLSRVGVTELLPDGKTWRIIHFTERQDADSSAERGKEFRKRNSDDPLFGSQNRTIEIQKPNENQTKRSLDKKRIEGDREGEESRAEETLPENEIDFGRSTFTPQLAEDIVRSVTNWMSIPATERDKAIDAVQDIYIRRCGASYEKTIEYLRPFFREARDRYPDTIRCFWLTDWAVTGSIPNPRKSGNTELDRMAAARKELGING